MFLPNPGILSAGASSGPPNGQTMYTRTLLTSQMLFFTVPTGVTSLCAVAIGQGEHLPANHTLHRGGQGGNLRYVNNITVSPSETLRILFEEGMYCGVTRNSGSYETLVAASYGINPTALNVGTGFNGGVSGSSSTRYRPGGGAGGYTSAGSSLNTDNARGGQGSDPFGRRLTGGGVRTADDYVGENYGGGAGKSLAMVGALSYGGAACIRLIWGAGRAFPNTLTEDMT